MCKVIVMDEDGLSSAYIATKETPNQILEHCKINPKTKIVYMNGKILSNEKMKAPLPETGVVHLAIRNKTVTR